MKLIEGAGRPRGELVDKKAVVRFDLAIRQQAPIVIVPVLRRYPELYMDPIFYLVYDETRIEDRVSPAETDEQSLFVARARREAGVRLTTFANGGWREEETAVRMKNEGLTAGMPDLIVYGAVLREDGEAWRQSKAETVGRGLKTPRWDSAFDRSLVAPIFIEMKKRNGSLGDIRQVQIDTMEDISRQGWPTCVAFGSKAAFAWLRHCGLLAPE